MNNLPMKTVLLLTFLVGLLSFPVAAQDESTSITVFMDGVPIEDSVTIDLNKEKKAVFTYEIHQSEPVTSAKFLLLNNDKTPTDKATLASDGTVSFISTTDTDKPLLLRLKIGNRTARDIYITVINSKVELEDIRVKFDPLYINLDNPSVNLYNNIEAEPIEYTLIKENTVFLTTTKGVTLNGDGILSYDGLSPIEVSIFVQSKENPAISKTFTVIFQDPVEVTGVSAPQTLELTTVDLAYPLTVGTIPPDSTEQAAANFSYTSSNPGVVVVDNDGLLYPKSVGEATIHTTLTVNNKNFSADTVVTVTKGVAVQGITVNKETIELTTLKQGKTQEQLHINFKPTNTTQKSLEFISQAPSVATVDENGIITAQGQGKTSITVKDAQGHMKYVAVSVSDNPLVSDYITVTAYTPDVFTVLVKDIHNNPALSLSNNTVQNVTAFTYSSPDMKDLIIKPLTYNPLSNSWEASYTVNQNDLPNFFIDASNINVQIYASTDPSNSGNMVGYAMYDYVNHGTSPTNICITPYAQDIGFITPSVGQDEIAGTVGEGRQLEGIRLSTPISDVNLKYAVHAADFGWMDPVNEGQYAGTMGQNRRIEAITISLEGYGSGLYDIEYRAHVQDLGWLDWVRNGEIAGTTGEGRQLEAIQVRLIKR